MTQSSTVTSLLSAVSCQFTETSGYQMSLTTMSTRVSWPYRLAILTPDTGLIA